MFHCTVCTGYYSNYNKISQYITEEPEPIHLSPVALQKHMPCQPHHHNDIFPNIYAPVPTSWMSKITKVTLRLSYPSPEAIETPLNVFGLFQKYLSPPSHNPDATIQDNQHAVVASLETIPMTSGSQSSGSQSSALSQQASYFPFPNFSQYTGDMPKFSEIQSLQNMLKQCHILF